MLVKAQITRALAARLLGGFCTFLIVSLCHADQNESKKNTATLTVIDTYVEVHSGPGRGFPVFYVIEQGETIEVLTRRPGWYEIRSPNGRVGWTRASQIARTIQATGEPADLPSVSYGDYIRGSWVTGFSFGEVASGELDGFDMFSVNAGYRFLSWLGADIEAGRIFGADASGDFYAANVYLEPLSHWKLSPFVSAGLGEIKLSSQPKQVEFSTDRQDFNSYGIGGSYYLGRNFVIRGEYRWYSISATDQSDERLGTWKLGFVTFF